jgi:ATP-dependent DNA helicase DinG
MTPKTTDQFYRMSPPSPNGRDVPLHPVLPPPNFFGLPDKFDAWRPGQDILVQDIVTSDHRFFMPVSPTGSGKSLAYITAAVLSGVRTLVLTSTNALLAQLLGDFGELAVGIKGKSHYRCKALGHGATCDKGACNYGGSCHLKDGGCPYWDQVRRAKSAGIVITNYAFWIYNNRANPDTDVLGEFGLLVCDEAHDAPDRVADAYTVRFSVKNHVERYLLQPYDWVSDHRSVSDWATRAIPEVERQYKEARAAGHVERTFQAVTAKRKLKEVIEMCASPENVVIVPEKKWGVLRVAVAWPFDRAGKVLFRNIPRVVMTSATVRMKTAGMMGIGSGSGGDVVMTEYPHVIPVERRMLYHVPTIRVNYRTTPIQMRTWMMRIDQIIRSRTELNGIVHPVSYARRNLIIKDSKFTGIMMTHDTKTAMDTVARFKRERGHVLVSPSVTTGHDFAYDTARYQIIGKIAYPDTSDPITKERCNRDPDYGPYVAMQTLVQTAGRIVRAADDWGESFIIDDNIKWFMPKYGHFAPDWFLGAYQSLNGVMAYDPNKWR